MIGLINYLQPLEEINADNEKIPRGIPGKFFKTKEGRIFQLHFNYGLDSLNKDSPYINEVIFFDYEVEV